MVDGFDSLNFKIFSAKLFQYHNLNLSVNLLSLIVILIIRVAFVRLSGEELYAMIKRLIETS